MLLISTKRRPNGLFKLYLGVASILLAHSASLHAQIPVKLPGNAQTGTLSLNAYADFGYAVGPQRKHTFYNYITGDTATEHGRRDYTSYPLYVNQFSLSLAYIQAQYEIKDQFRLRFALQTGHIPDALYYAEHPSLRYVREAAVLYHFNTKWSLEAGIFPSYFGSEVPLNKENLHATRGYIADYAPDYEAGVRLHRRLNETNTLSLMILSGWQEIRDANGKKALAISWGLHRPGVINGNWNVYLGDERQLGASAARWRMYHNIYYRLYMGKRWLILPAFDLVFQEKLRAADSKFGSAGYNYVLGAAFSARYALTEKYGIAGRYDYVGNKADIVEELKTGSPNGWQSHSGTLTFEYLPMPQLTFRTEFRYGTNKDAVFRNANNLPTRVDWYGIATAAFHF